jgi:hypothetical protein
VASRIDPLTQPRKLTVCATLIRIRQQYPFVLKLLATIGL